MLTNEQLKDHMREAFCEELDFGATCIFDELTPEEQDRIIGIGDDQEWGDLEDASYRGGQYNDELTDDQKTAAIRRFYESGGPMGVYANHLPADTVEHYHLHDIVKVRGWVRHTGEHIDGYYPPEAIERMKLEEEQDRIDARDLELGRNIGRNLADIKGLVEASKAQGDRIEGKVGEVGRIVVEKKAETERRLAGQTSKAIELDRKLKLAEAENARLRGNDTK